MLDKQYSETDCIIDMHSILESCKELLLRLTPLGISEGCIREHMGEVNYVMDLIYKTAFGGERNVLEEEE